MKIWIDWIDPKTNILYLWTDLLTTVINLGNAWATLNTYWTINNQLVTNLNVTDKLFTINKWGAIASGFNSWFEIEENSVITWYFSTNATRDGFSVKAPSSFEFELLASWLTANRIYTLPNLAWTIALTTDLWSYLPLAGWIMTGNVDMNWDIDTYIRQGYNTAVNSIWRAFTIRAWGSTVGSTDKNWGTLQLKWWSATGTWRSAIQLFLSVPWVSGTTEIQPTLVWQLAIASWSPVFSLSANQSTVTPISTNNFNVNWDLAWWFVQRRHWTADTAWNQLTVQSWWATSWATDKNGWTLVLSSWISTWSGW